LDTPLIKVALSDIGPLHDAPVLRAIDGCANLTSLVLAPCPYLTETFLSIAVMGLPHLLRLALSGCTQVSDGTLSLLAAHLPSIEELVLTESNGFTDTGLFALEGCSRLKQLSLHPLEKVTAVGLEALCDQCDALEGLLLAHCPAASMSVLEQVLACCLHLRVLVVTHAPNATEAGVRRMLAASDVLRVLAVVPGAGEPRTLLPPDAAERLADEFADALLVTTWADLDAVLDVEVQPHLRPKPPLRLKLPPRLTRPLPPRPPRPAPPLVRIRRGADARRGAAVGPWAGTRAGSALRRARLLVRRRAAGRGPCRAGRRPGRRGSAAPRARAASRHRVPARRPRPRRRRRRRAQRRPRCAQRPPH